MDSEIITYQDIVEHLLDVFDSSRAGRDLRMARRASREALRELNTSHRWAIYEKRRTLRTVASQTTGTITYDHDNLLVTLTDGTFPTDVRYYRIIIDNVHYPIDSYVSSTTCTLTANQNPGADITDDTSYTIYRNSYPLPVDFVEMGRLWDLENQLEMRVVLPDQIHQQQIWYYETPDTPWIVAIMNEGEFLNSLSLVFAPPPSSARSYDYMYHRVPKQLSTEKYSTGTAACTLGTTTVTITTGVVSDKHAGAIIRMGDDTNEPGNIFGGIDDTDYPFAEQRVILAVDTGSNSYTIDNAFASAYSGVKYTVSDPVDIENQAMLTAFQRLAEAAFTRLTKRELKHRTERESIAMSALILAKERDQRASVAMGKPAPYDYFRRTNITTEN